MTASSSEIPEQLVERARTGRVAIFVGAGCCRSAGLPGWEELLRRLERRAEAEHLLNREDEGRLKAWFRKADDFPRIAKLFKDRFPGRYRDWMQDIFDPSAPAAPLLRPPAYFYLLRSLPLTRVLTTNFDQLLEDALQPGWTSLTWQDADELPRFLRSDRRLIFHAHGRADRFGTLVHTLDEYQELSGNAGREAREFLLRIFESSTVLFLGYRLGDPVIRWLQDRLRSDWDLEPDWYALSPDPSDEEREREREQRKLHLIAYHPASDGDRDAAHEKGLTRWLTAWLERLGVAAAVPEEIGAAVEPSPALVEIDDAYLSAQPPATPELCQRYYRGEPARWSLVREEHTAPRWATEEILKRLAGDGMRAVLLLGAGGEGKSTIMMQVGLALKEEGFRVVWSPEGEGDLFAALKDRRGKSVALLVDQADQRQDLPRLLRFADKRWASTRIVLAARVHEWNESQSRLAGDAARLLQRVSLRTLDRGEAGEIARLLVANGLAVGDSAAVAGRLLADTNGFLLAAMLTATHGEELAAILADVVAKIRCWPGSEPLLEALAVVVALEARRDKRGRHYWCSLRLLAEALGISKQKVKALCGRLTGEVSLRLRGGYRVETRHPVIAETLFPILFRVAPPVLDEMEIHGRILEAAGRLAGEHVKAPERQLLTILPLAYRRTGDQESARWLFKKATEADPRDAVSWQAWALLERDHGNPGSIDDQHTARWLFKKSTEADPRHAASWQAWALLEADHGNPGSIDDQHTARWLFKKSTEADPRDAASWQAWALLEERHGNRERFASLLAEGLRRCPNARELLDLQRRNFSPADPDSIEELLAGGDCAAAEAALKEALLEDPTDPHLLELHRRWRELCAKPDS